MSPAAYVVFSILLSMFFAWLAVRVVARSAAASQTGRPSVVIVLLAIASWGFLSFVVVSLALSTTNTVQTSIIVSNMEGNPPFRAIAAHDLAERDRLRAAVSRGLEQGKDGDIRKTVMDSVSAELAPYMNRRLQTAPDSVYLALAPIVAEGMTKARLMGRCIVPGDRNGADLRRHLDSARIMTWAETLISTPPAARSQTADPTGGAAGRMDLVDRAVARGVVREQAIAALTPDAPGNERCTAAAAMLTAAAADVDSIRGARDARVLLKGFVLPG